MKPVILTVILFGNSPPFSGSTTAALWLLLCLNKTINRWVTDIHKAQKALLLKSSKTSKLSYSMCAKCLSVSSHIRLLQLSMLFLQPLITSFSHCCWQFSTSVLWELLLPGIVFFLSAFFFSWSEASSHFRVPEGVWLLYIPTHELFTQDDISRLIFGNYH